MTDCKESPDKKHHYDFARSQHAVMNHMCYQCAYCGQGKCITIIPPRVDKLKLPTDEDLDNE